VVANVERAEGGGGGERARLINIKVSGWSVKERFGESGPDDSE